MTADDAKTQAQLRIVFSKTLCFLLPRRYRAKPVERTTLGKVSIKNVIESLGVPHTEVGQILANGQAVGFDYIPEGRVQIEVRSVVPPLEITRPSLLRPEPFDGLRFVVDENVGKLALLLRILGIDTAYAPGWTDRHIVDRAQQERRVVLSKDVELLKCRQIRFGRLVRRVLPDGQLAEIVHFFGIRAPFRLFSRCLRCNRLLTPVAKADIMDLLEPKTKKYYQDFKRCPDCRRVYWRGSHHGHMIQRLRHAGIHISEDRPMATEACPSD